LINADTHVGVIEWITSQSGGWVVSLASSGSSTGHLSTKQQRIWE